MQRLGGTGALVERIAELMGKESHVVWRQHKGRSRPIDVRGALVALALGDEGAQASLAEAEVPGSLVAVRAILRVSPDGTARPIEVVTALTGDEAFPHRVVRLGLLAGDRSPLEVVAHPAATATRATNSTVGAAPTTATPATATPATATQAAVSAR